MVTTIPTIGFNVETVFPDLGNFNLWDVGGQKALVTLWKHYYLSTHGLIFVIDPYDTERFQEAKTELHNIWKSEDMLKKPTLILFNKFKNGNSASKDELIKKLDIEEEATKRKIKVLMVNSTSENGIMALREWFAGVYSEC